MALNEQISRKASQNGAAAGAALGGSLAQRQNNALAAFAAADLIAATLAAALQIWTTAWLSLGAAPQAGTRDLLSSLLAATERAFLSPGASLQLAVLTAVTLAALAAGGLYSRNVWEQDEGRRALTAGLIVYMIHAIPSDAGAIALHGVAAALAALFLALSLTTLRMALRATPTLRNALVEPTLLVGDGMEAEGFKAQLRESRGPRETIEAQISVAEFIALATKPNGRAALAERIGAPLESLAVVLAPSAQEMPQTEAALQAIGALGLPGSFALPSRALSRRRLAPRRVFASEMTLLDLAPPRNSGAMGRSIKRIFDATACGAALLILSPVLLAIMLALKSSYGWGASIFFTQKRVGKGRERFDCLKFRTMAPDAEERLQALLASDPQARLEWETYQKLSNDPRITPVGRFLRKTSLDELPQLLNVLRGEMSLVGPRPIVAPELKGYVNDAAYYDSPEFEAYASLRPGVTGLWQVSGRAATAYSERMRLDAWYADNWSLWLDAIIILKTARAAILGGGAS